MPSYVSIYWFICYLSDLFACLTQLLAALPAEKIQAHAQLCEYLLVPAEKIQAHAQLCEYLLVYILLKVDRTASILFDLIYNKKERKKKKRRKKTLIIVCPVSEHMLLTFESKFG